MKTLIFCLGIIFFVSCSSKLIIDQQTSIIGYENDTCYCDVETWVIKKPNTITYYHPVNKVSCDKMDSVKSVQMNKAVIYKVEIERYLKMIK
jgi:hypothetical protein